MYKGKHPRVKPQRTTKPKKLRSSRNPKYYDTPHIWNSFYRSTDIDSRFNPSYVSSITPVSFGKSDVKQGVDNPRWKELRAKGQDASSPYTRITWGGDMTRFTNSVFRTDVVPYGYRLTSEATVGYPFGVSSIDPYIADANLLDIAVGTMKRKIQTEIKNVSVVTPFGELLKDFHHTVRSMVQLTTPFIYNYAQLIRQSRNKGKEAAQYLANAWLTYSFGMSPLMAEAKSIAEAVAAQNARNGHFVRLQTGATKDWFSSDHNTSVTAGAYGGVDVDTQIYHTLSYKVICGIDTQMLPNNWSYTEQLGVDWRYVPGLLWEWVPFSWIADYFGTIGAFLDDQFVIPPGMTSYIVVDRKYHCEATSSVSPAKALSAIALQKVSQFGNGGFSCDAFTRTVLTALPHATIRFRSWEATNPSGRTETSNYAVSKLLNLVAVVISGNDFRYKR